MYNQQQQQHEHLQQQQQQPQQHYATEQNYFATPQANEQQFYYSQYEHATSGNNVYGSNEQQTGAAEQQLQEAGGGHENAGSDNISRERIRRGGAGARSGTKGRNRRNSKTTRLGDLSALDTSAADESNEESSRGQFPDRTLSQSGTLTNGANNCSAASNNSGSGSMGPERVIIKSELPGDEAAGHRLMAEAAAEGADDEAENEDENEEEAGVRTTATALGDEAAGRRRLTNVGQPEELNDETRSSKAAQLKLASVSSGAGGGGGGGGQSEAAGQQPQPKQSLIAH